jgi:hypothetical protein
MGAKVKNNAKRKWIKPKVVWAPAIKEIQKSGNAKPGKV